MGRMWRVRVGSTGAAALPSALEAAEAVHAEEDEVVALAAEPRAGAGAVAAEPPAAALAAEPRAEDVTTEP